MKWRLLNGDVKEVEKEEEEEVEYEPNVIVVDTLQLALNTQIEVIFSRIQLNFVWVDSA